MKTALFVLGLFAQAWYGAWLGVKFGVSKFGLYVSWIQSSVEVLLLVIYTLLGLVLGLAVGWMFYCLLELISAVMAHYVNYTVLGKTTHTKINGE